MRVKLSVFLSVCILFLAFTSCKKKKDTEPVPDNSNITTTGATPTPSLMYNGKLIAEKYYSWSLGNGNFVSYFCKSIITTSASTELGIVSSGMNLGILKTNNIQLQYNPGIKMYLDSIGAINYSSTISYQHNSAGLGNINFTNTDTFPRYTPMLAAGVNDTVEKSKNFIVPLAGLTYYNTVFIGIYDPSQPLLSANKTVNFGSGNLTFTPSDLAVLPNSSGCVIRIIIKKYNDQTINGKLFRFENDSYNDFYAILKP